jgi:hypothetical protein
MVQNVFSERCSLSVLTKSEGAEMKRKLMAVALAAIIGLTTVAIPNKVEARWRGGGWWIPGAVVGGLALGALAARPYYYGPGYYGYAYEPGPYYGGYGYGPYDYEYGQYYYGGPRYYYGRPYRHWTEF